jgi:hypothetical protein
LLPTRREQWQVLEFDPALLDAAIEETLRS